MAAKTGPGDPQVFVMNVQTCIFWGVDHGLTTSPSLSHLTLSPHDQLRARCRAPGDTIGAKSFTAWG